MRIIDADKLIEDIEGIDWYSTNRCGVLHEGAIDKYEAYYRAYDIISAIQNATTLVDREALILVIQNAVGGCARNWAELIADAVITRGMTLVGGKE